MYYQVLFKLCRVSYQKRKTSVYTATYSHSSRDFLIYMSDSTFQAKRPIYRKSSEYFVCRFSSLEQRSYRALWMIRMALCFSPKSGPAMIYTFSDILATKYVFLTAVVYISSLFNSTRDSRQLTWRFLF